MRLARWRPTVLLGEALPSLARAGRPLSSSGRRLLASRPRRTARWGRRLLPPRRSHGLLHGEMCRDPAHCLVLAVRELDPLNATLVRALAEEIDHPWR